MVAIAKAVPQAKHFIIGNEPNLNRFWLPQFGPSGEDVAAVAYVSLLAKSYDALKALSPANEVLGGVLSHAGSDNPAIARQTHSPTQFILDMGAAYRANGRAAPIMDAFSFHPYMLRSDEPPTTTHADTTITIADYPKLVATLGQAFDGTGQKGSTLPIVYDEFGVESTIPAEKSHLYTGVEAATVHPVDQATQAQYYAQALQLAFCQPNVQAFLVFSLLDENALAGWQSGVYYADGTPKSSLEAVEAAADRVRRNLVACPGLQVTPRLGLRWFPQGRPTAEPSTFPVSLTCDVDCVYRDPDRAGGDARDDALGERARDRPRADHGRVPPDSAAAGELPDHGVGECDGERRPAGDGNEPGVYRQAALAAVRSSSSSAIWIAFSAAPLRRLSHARKRTIPFSSVGSCRMRPTSTSSIPFALPGDGKSSSRTLGAAPRSAFASSGESFDSVSIQTVSAWPTITGTRTQFALTGSSGSSMILRVSSRSFVSSSNSSPS